METQSVSYAAFIGIDWADEQHDVCVLSADALFPEQNSLKQDPEAIDTWARQVRERFGGRPVAV
jgi:hypothetical protein